MVEDKLICRSAKDKSVIIHAIDVCPYFEQDAQSTCTIRECWYCRYADFRKTDEILLDRSICRLNLKNE